MTDSVGNHDVMADRVQKLARAEENAGEVIREERTAGSGRPVEDQDRVANGSGSVAPRLPEGAVVNFQLRQRLSAGEVKVPDHEIAGGGLGSRGGPGTGSQHQRE